MNAELVIVDCQDKRLKGEIILADHSYLIELGRYSIFAIENNEFSFCFTETFSLGHMFYIYQLTFYSSFIADDYLKVA